MRAGAKNPINERACLLSNDNLPVIDNETTPAVASQGGPRKPPPPNVLPKVTIIPPTGRVLAGAGYRIQHVPVHELNGDRAAGYPPRVCRLSPPGLLEKTAALSWAEIGWAR